MNSILHKFLFLQKEIIKSWKDLEIKKISFVLLCIFMTYYISKKIFEPFNMYDEHFWLDIPMHILGGFLFSYLFLLIINKNYATLKNTIYFVFFIGISWEVLEFILDIVNLKTFVGWADTFKDLFDDMLGAFLAFKFSKNK